MIEYFDTHFHIEPEDDLDEVTTAACEAGVKKLLSAGTSVGNDAVLLDRIAPYPNLYAAVGIHPHEAEKFDGNISPYREWLSNPKVKAVGEIGLDYFYDNSPREAQRSVFREFLDLAAEVGYPAIVHIREASDDALELLTEFAKEWSHKRAPFVVHCFSGSPAYAEELLELGGYLSFTGIITYKRAQEMRDALSIVPLDRLMFETDSPYLAPIPHRGRRNQPAYVAKIVQFAAEELNIPLEELAAATTANAYTFFDITE